MITATLPIQREDDYQEVSTRLRDEAADLLRQLDRLDPATPSAKRQMLLNRLDVVLLEQERVEWQEQQRIGGW